MNRSESDDLERWLLAPGKQPGTMVFSPGRNFMGVSRFLSMVVSGLFGLYCLIWSLFASTAPTRMRGGAAFIGILLLLLMLVYARTLAPHES